MRTKLIFGVLLVLVALISPIVSAESFLIKGNVQPSFSMSVSSVADISFPLNTIGQNDLTTSTTVTAVSNVPYSVKFKDATVCDLCPPIIGRMKALGVSGYSGAALANPLSVSLNGAYITITGADQTAHAGTPGDGLTAAPIKFRQTVTISDPVLATPYVYQMLVQVTGGANP